MAAYMVRLERGIFRRRNPKTGTVFAPLWVSYQRGMKTLHAPVPDVTLPNGTTRLATVPEARRFRARKTAEASAGGGAPRGRLTVGALLDGLLEDYQLNARAGLRTVRGHVRMLRAEFGSLQAADVTARRVRAWQGRLIAAGKVRVTVKRYSETLRRAFKLALAEGEIAAAPLIPMPEAHSKRGLYIPVGDHTALAEELPDYVVTMLDFARLYGTRRGQLSRTRRDWVDLDRGCISWPPEECKARDPHVLPLDEPGLELVRRLFAGKQSRWCPYLFHGPRCAAGRRPSKVYGCVGDFKKAWAAACARAGMPVGRQAGGFVFHHTRNTAATDMRAAGMSTEDIMQVGGWKTEDMVRRYDLGDLEALRERMAAARGKASELRKRGAR